MTNGRPPLIATDSTTSAICSRAIYEALFTNRIVLYGAGITGVETYNVLTHRFAGARVAGFCDRFKTGSMLGLGVITPFELKAMCNAEPLIVIITALSENAQGIATDLRALDIGAVAILELDDFDRIVVENADGRIDSWYTSVKATKAILSKKCQESLYLNWWCPEHYIEGDILVYQPGKVGSSSVCNSLFLARVSATHVHMLTDAFVYDLVPELRWKPTAGDAALIDDCGRSCVARIKSSGPLKIITLVREPLIRDFSHFCYHLPELFQAGCFSPDDDLAKVCADGIRLRATQNGRAIAGYQFDWFDAELKTVFGIDVLNHPFDQEQGYAIIRERGVELLLVKVERLDRLERVVADFANAPDFTLKSVNQASGKTYRELYSSLRETVEITPDVVSMYYDGNRFMNHFYSEDERRAFLRGWDGNIAA